MLKPVFNYITATGLTLCACLISTQFVTKHSFACTHEQSAFTAGTTADGFSLTDLSAEIRLKTCQPIVNLFEMVKHKQPDAFDLMLTSETGFWPSVFALCQHQTHRLVKGRILRSAFVNATLKVLENICWGNNESATEALCFIQKQQVTCQRHEYGCMLKHV